MGPKQQTLRVGEEWRPSHDIGCFEANSAFVSHVLLSAYLVEFSPSSLPLLLTAFRRHLVGESWSFKRRALGTGRWALGRAASLLACFAWAEPCSQ